jgi:hypothetical protein
MHTQSQVLEKSNLLYATGDCHAIKNKSDGSQ